MARTCLHRHDIPFFQVEVVDVVIICLSGVLKLHFHKVCAFGIARHIGKPVVCVQLSVLASYCLAAETSVATIPHSEFHILVIHNNLILIMYNFMIYIVLYKYFCTMIIPYLVINCLY